MSESIHYYECGCCGAYHKIDFFGDCRDNSERFIFLPLNAELRDPDDWAETKGANNGS